MPWMLDHLSIDTGTEGQFISKATATVKKNKFESDFGAPWHVSYLASDKDLILLGDNYLRCVSSEYTGWNLDTKEIQKRRQHSLLNTYLSTPLGRKCF